MAGSVWPAVGIAWISAVSPPWLGVAWVTATTPGTALTASASWSTVSLGFELVITFAVIVSGEL